jgi:two-component system, OmpR family, response regulator ChvI
MQVIGLVDDDRRTQASVSSALEREGYQILQYTDGQSALRGFSTGPPDLAILDIGTPGRDGIELLRRLRQTCFTPVIFFTSKDDEINEILALKMGADDVIRKPFSLRVLTERVRTVLKRAPQTSGADETVDNTAIECGQLLIDVARHICAWKNKPVLLTRAELWILQALVSRPGVVRTPRALMDAVHDRPTYVGDRVIAAAHVKRMRKKLRAIDDSFDMIETLYGVGYRFKEP